MGKRFEFFPLHYYTQRKHLVVSLQFCLKTELSRVAIFLLTGTQAGLLCMILE